jgi:hypothetical protein
MLLIILTTTGFYPLFIQTYSNPLSYTQLKPHSQNKHILATVARAACSAPTAALCTGAKNNTLSQCDLSRLFQQLLDL